MCKEEKSSTVKFSIAAELTWRSKTVWHESWDARKPEAESSVQQMLFAALASFIEDAKQQLFEEHPEASVMEAASQPPQKSVEDEDG